MPLLLCVLFVLHLAQTACLCSKLAAFASLCLVSAAVGANCMLIQRAGCCSLSSQVCLCRAQHVGQGGVGMFGHCVAAV